MENARTLADTLGWKSIHPGQLMRNEVDKKTELGKKISDAQKAYHFGKLHFKRRY
jgi:adenylate kinase family enzyme